MTKHLLIEKYVPAVRLQGGINTALPITLNGTSANLTVGGALTVTGTTMLTGAVTLNGNVVGYLTSTQDNQNQTVAATYAVSHTIFVNDNVSGTYKIVAVAATFGTASGSGTLQVEVATGTQAIGSGTVQLTGTVSLAGTANTPVNGTVIASPTTITAGSRINLIFAGTVTGLANMSANVILQKIS